MRRSARSCAISGGIFDLDTREERLRNLDEVMAAARESGLFIFVMSLFLLAALVYNPLDSLIGVALTLAGAPVYRVLSRRQGDARES